MKNYGNQFKRIASSTSVTTESTRHLYPNNGKRYPETLMNRVLASVRNPAGRVVRNIYVHTGRQARKELYAVRYRR